MADQRGAIITGGAQGIGRCIVETLLEKGWQVAVIDPDNEAGTAMMAETGREALRYFCGDVSDESHVTEFVPIAADLMGRLDLLVNNAGIADPDSGPVEQLDRERWDRIIGVNLAGAFLMTKHAVPFLKTWGGSIVNIGSTRALQSEPDTEAYAASKGGLTALTHALAVSLGPVIRVNIIQPGWIEVGNWRKPSARTSPTHRDIDNRQHPAGRVGRPQDVAGLVCYLASDAAAFITGQQFVVDGGMTRKMIYAE